MKNNNIIKLRKKLDLLDNKFLNLIKKRSILVDKILKQKTLKNQIINWKRIKAILKNIRKKSLIKKIDKNLTERIWKAIIKESINYEFKNFKKKKWNYLLWGGNFFSIKNSCFFVSGLYFFSFNLILAFSPFDGFLT